MGKKGIPDPLSDITNWFRSFQNQLANACKLPEIVSNPSLEGLAGVSKKCELAGVSKNINDNIFKPSDILKNSPFAKFEEVSKHFSQIDNTPNLVRGISTKSILSTTSSIQLYRSISVSRSPIIPPLVAPDEFYSPLPNPFPRITTDEVHERSVPLEEDHVPSPQPSPLEISQRVLIVGGSSDGSYNAIARIIRKLGLQPIVFDEQPNGGWTSVEKLEAYADIDFVIVLLTSDDKGAPKDKLCDLKPRTCQNVISRLSYFWGALGRDRICILRKGDIELPSDIDGWIHESMDGNGGWQLYLAREMKYAGLPIDQNKLI